MVFSIVMVGSVSLWVLTEVNDHVTMIRWEWARGHGANQQHQSVVMGVQTMSSNMIRLIEEEGDATYFWNSGSSSTPPMVPMSKPNNMPPKQAEPAMAKARQP